MPYLDNHNKIQAQAKNYEVKAPEAGWDKISSKLKAAVYAQKKKKARIIRFIASVAASSALVIAFFSIVYMESAKPQFITKAQVKNLEELNTASDYFYSIQNARRSNELFQDYTDDLMSSSLEGTSGLPAVFRNDPI